MFRSTSLAIFGKNKGNDDNGSDDLDRALSYEPEKAKAWFKQARTVQETGNYDYAINLWLRGLNFDPENMDALEAFMDASIAHSRSARIGS